MKINRRKDVLHKNKSVHDDVVDLQTQFQQKQEKQKTILEKFLM